MSDEQFLARWSRRKREANAGTDAPAAGPEPEEVAAPGGAAEPELDLSILPPIDSITAATDVTAFLRKGIPQELTRAALRRAWSADPTIRDFVGLAESAWDFNDPNAMAGFGPLDCSEAELGALVDRIVGAVRGAADVFAEREDAAQAAPLDRGDQQDADSTEAIAVAQDPDRSGVAEALSDPVALQPAADRAEGASTLVRRRTHGGALPE